MQTKHKVFISYHHANDQDYKDELIELNKKHDIFIDSSVDTGEIDDELPSDTIRQIIRDEYLKDSTVTILLVGTETKNRKHIDWELYSSMYDGIINKKSGILVINLPSTECEYFTAVHKGEKEKLYPNQKEWMAIDNRTEYVRRYPFMPDRIIDNLLNSEAKISVVNWENVSSNMDNLKFLIEQTFNEKGNCKYDLTRSMKRKNS